MAERQGGGNDSGILVSVTNVGHLDSDLPDSSSSVDGGRVYADSLDILLRRAELVASA